MSVSMVVCSAYKETISRNLSELLFPFLLQFKSIFCKVQQRMAGNPDTSLQQPASSHLLFATKSKLLLKTSFKIQLVLVNADIKPSGNRSL